jgi:diguanylate cyclase (GGDEF)-like protein
LKRRFHNVALQRAGGGRESADAPWTRRDLVLGGVALLLLGAVSLLTRDAGQLRPLAVTVALALALACFGRALTRHNGRRASLALGAALLAWALGGIAWALESPPTTPSAADLFSLLFYPLAAMALLLLVGPELQQRRTSAWLDAAVAGLGAAAICSAFAFDSVVRLSGSAASAAVSLAYPVGAVALFALALGVVVLAPRHPGRTSLFALGSALLALGGIVSLHQLSPSALASGAPLDLLVPAGMVAMTGSLWLRPRLSQRSPLAEKAPRMAILALVLAACPVLLVLGNLGRVNAIALGLAGATIIVAATRMAVSLREQRALNVSQQQQATTDDLTGLGNRRRLLDELQRALAGMPEGGTQASGLALLLIDLDHFKEINDSFGHQTGDALLREIGPRIRQVVRRNDLVARLGGDEFAVVLYGADAYKATTVARRITTLLQEPIDVSTASLHVGASIGVALAPAHATGADELIRCADIAMYRAKNERGSFDVYEAALDDEGDRFELIEDLRVAMADRSLALHYQPVIDLRTGEVLTVEALLRWSHPTLGLIPPEHLLALAEESGLIHSLATWVFEEAVADCARWWHDGHRAAVAVNLLATDLLDSSLPRRVGALLAQAGLPTDALVLEITEGMVVADVTRSKRVIQSLTDSGIRVSIDDFGTGFSSISHLNELAVGELKLDRTFTSRLQSEEPGGRDEDIVRSIIDLGHALGLRVVAEGIERLAFMEVLAALGCDAGQGYAIQAPGPAAAIDFAGALRSAPGRAADSLATFNAAHNPLAP